MRLRFWPSAALALLAATPLCAVTPHLVKDINPIPSTAGSTPRDFVAAAGVAFFAASDGEAGNELWRTDGTLPGTFRITDACPGECSSQIRTVAATSRSYFFLARGESGEDLWVTSGTPAGTFRLTSSLAFPASGPIWQAWIASQGVLYFSASRRTTAFMGWSSGARTALPRGPSWWRTCGEGRKGPIRACW